MDIILVDKCHITFLYLNKVILPPIICQRIQHQGYDQILPMKFLLMCLLPHGLKEMYGFEKSDQGSNFQTAEARKKTKTARSGGMLVCLMGEELASLGCLSEADLEQGCDQRLRSAILDSWATPSKRIFGAILGTNLWKPWQLLMKACCDIHLWKIWLQCSYLVLFG